jgi:hypothetical protein
MVKKAARKKSVAKPASARSAAPASRKAVEPLKVRATGDGYYEDVYRRAGDVFTIPSEPRNRKTGLPALFGKWMEFVDPKTPDRLMSLGNAALRQESSRVLEEKAAQKAAGGAVATGVDNPDDGLNPLGAE